jgi:hypothetical protein
MADKIEEEEINESGYTNFGGTPGRGGTFFNPSGPIGRFFAKFFATKAQLDVQRQMDSGEQISATGDTFKTTDVIRDPDQGKGPAVGGGRVANPVLPQIELNRKKRYREYEEMDEYPEIGAAFDIYADDSTQKGQKAERWTIKSDDSMLVDEVENLFDRIRLDKLLWDISRNTVKYGDCFTEMIVDVNRPEEGVKKIKILNPNWMLRVEDEYGYLKQFMQEIPDLGNMAFMDGGYGQEKPLKYVKLDKHQIVHFRLHTSDPVFYPYGKSIAALCHRTFRSLKMMEDAMMIYRLSRAPERRIFYVDTGNLPTSKAEMFIERVKQKFKKEKFYNGNQGQINSRYNPMSLDEDFFIATRNGQGTKIDTLPGAQNLGEIEDVRYYRDKLLAALKVPKDYLVEKDSSPERKANLSQLDVKFARTVQRIQVDIETGMENLAKRHLQLKGYPAGKIKKLKIKLPEPSDMSAKRKLDVDEQKTRVIQAVQQLGLISQDQIYREYFDMNDKEIEKMKKELAAEQEKAAQEQAQQAASEQLMGAGAAAGGPGAGPGAAPPGGGPGYGEAGGQEPAENVPPTANESKETNYQFMIEHTDDENVKRVMARIMEKQRQKADGAPER